MKRVVVAVLATVLPAFVIAQTRGVVEPCTIIPPGYTYAFKSLSRDFGIGPVTSIIRSRTGFLWLSNLSAIYRYDGYEARRYEDDPADPMAKITNQTYRLLEDHAGTLWAGTAGGLKRLEPGGTGFIRFTNRRGDSTSIPPGRITAICEDRRRRLWVGTDRGVIARFDSSHFLRYTLPGMPQPPASQPRVYAIFEDSSGVLWTMMTSTMYTYDLASDRFVPAASLNADLRQHGVDTVFFAMVDRKNQLWFSTSAGLLCYDVSRSLAKQYVHDPHDTASISAGTPLFPVEDAFGDLWVALFEGGVDKLEVQSDRFLHFRGNAWGSKSIDLRPICSDPPAGNVQSTNIWCNTSGEPGHIIVQKVALAQPRTPLSHALAGDSSRFNVWTLMTDRRGRLWAGGWISGGVLRLDSNRATATFFPPGPAKSSGLGSQSVFQLYEDPWGTIWMLTPPRLCRFDETQNSIVHVPLPVFPLRIFVTRDGIHWMACADSTRPRAFLAQWDPRTFAVGPSFPREADSISIPDGAVRDVYEDRDGLLWIGTFTGGLYRFDRRTKQYSRYLSSSEDPHALKSTTITRILEDSTGTMWIATHYGLHKRVRDGEGFECIVPGWNRQEEAQAPREGAFIRDMTMDNHGYLWLAVDEFCDRFDPRTGAWQRYREETGIHLTYASSITYDARRHIVSLGGIGGIFFFDPDSIAAGGSPPPVVITRLKVLDKDLAFRGEVGTRDTLDLSYSDNYLSFTFAVLDFANPAKNLYACFMEGLDRDWIQLGTRRYISYANLNPGTYRFRVRGASPNGVWNNAGDGITIVIAPPWWRTAWAYAGYLLAGLSVLYGVWVYDRRRVRLRHMLDMRVFEAEKMREVDQMKSRFFANISHEFRTPLTLILGPLDQLAERPKHPDAQTLYTTMRQNGLRLLNLINQLLDLSKMDAGKMTVQVRPLDLVALARPLTMSFLPLAERKHIQLIFDPEEDEIVVYADSDKIEKILVNLLSNAFKFTDDGGEIKVALRLRAIGGNRPSDTGKGTAGRWAEITVSDTGIGIDPNDLDKVFDRFYQTDSSHKVQYGGTGLGLALARELVELHNGHIVVASTLGKGTTFTVTLPLGKDHWCPEDIVTEDSLPIDHTDSVLSVLPVDEADMTSDAPSGMTGVATILVVEDNADVRTYLKGILKDTYRVEESENGKLALEKTLATAIDLVVSDIVMPVMDGIQLCRELKSDDRTSHIPVILLTARATVEGKLEGLGTGADDYIVKPFDPRELVARISNLIGLRKTLQEKYRRHVVLGPSNVTIPPEDERFLKKLTETIENHLVDPGFDTEGFAQAMCMSRMQLNRKLQALTGHATHELVREFRLQRAATLLGRHAGNVTEVAFEVGFNSLSHFSRVFRERFGILPSEYKGQARPH